MDFLELCKERFSVRKYTDKVVEKRELEYIEEAVRLAPSAVNKQPYRFLIVQSEAGRALPSAMLRPRRVCIGTSLFHCL